MSVKNVVTIGSLSFFQVQKISSLVLCLSKMPFFFPPSPLFCDGELKVSMLTWKCNVMLLSLGRTTCEGFSLCVREELREVIPETALSRTLD